MATTFPMQRPVPVTGEVSQMFRDGLAARGVEELPQQLVTSIDPAARVAHLKSGETMPYDLFVGIPVHRAPDPLAASGLAVDGWVPVDQTNLRTRFPNVYALGDVSSGPRTVPKAGIFAESAALVVADDIAAEISGEDATRAVRGVGHLLRRVRRRARQQGGGQLPGRPVPGGRAQRAVARVRRREGGVRRDAPRALVPRRLALGSVPCCSSGTSELSALRTLAEAAAQGEPGLVVIEGPAGIGKTRLLARGAPRSRRGGRARARRARRRARAGARVRRRPPALRGGGLRAAAGGRRRGGARGLRRARERRRRGEERRSRSCTRCTG